MVCSPMRTRHSVASSVAGRSQQRQLRAGWPRYLCWLVRGLWLLSIYRPIAKRQHHLLATASVYLDAFTVECRQWRAVRYVMFCLVQHHRRDASTFCPGIRTDIKPVENFSTGRALAHSLMPDVATDSAMCWQLTIYTASCILCMRMRWPCISPCVATPLGGDTLFFQHGRSPIVTSCT